MTSAHVTFGEVAAERRISNIPLSHVSVELGHLYMDDFEAGRDALRRQFERVRPWAETVTQINEGRVRRPRISTCFLIDDYFTRFSTPSVVIGDLLAASEAAGLRIDYIARESGCAVADGVPLAELVHARLVPDPPPGTNGSRPPPHESGWLSNGERSPSGGVDEAMGQVAAWLPPRENAARHHSIFLDVEMWTDEGDRRIWSCPYLAAVWQLLRLGLLRDDGRPVAVPVPAPDPLPDDWDDLPAIIQMVPSAPPFAAYTTMSVLSSRFLPVEHAVRVILGQVSISAAVLEQTVRRGADENLEIPRDILKRIGYAIPGEI
ncbi:SCO2522 family protein [Actinoallomurus spadix]|uniref:SCO2522 family protein n=1 Tax=Actinoallomurus spadix TaxID=79912 RepID=A0ABP3H6C5_9ACTN|nr:SCO2522 family protein [Actinoallomurus spadix]MCO5987747.1 SCO2522 family protein [Actinoallomurus spadix]